MTPFSSSRRERQREASDRELQDQIKALTTELEQKQEPIKKKILEQHLSSVPKELHEELRAIFATPAAKTHRRSKTAAQKYERILRIDTEDAKEADPAFKLQAEDLQRRIKLTEAKTHSRTQSPRALGSR